MKTILVFQGGGSLGAFGAGAWQALSSSPLMKGGRLAAVAGASIGALNAAVVAHHRGDADGGAGAMAELWRHRLSMPSVPFLGCSPLPLLPSAGPVTSWNGFLTGLLVGNRSMSKPAWPAWQPLSGLSRLQQPLHDRRLMHDLLAAEFPPYGSTASRPLLGVASVDVMGGTLRLFESDTEAIGPAHLAASSAIPLMFDPVEIEGRLYWDGEVTRDSMLPPLFDALAHGGRIDAREPVCLVTVEQMARGLAAPPQSGAEIAFRAMSLMQVDKLALPGEVPLHIVSHCRIVREPWPEDGVSGQMDFSPERIERLMAHGEDVARRALSRLEPAGSGRALRAAT